MNQLQADLKRLLTLLPKWHGSDGKPTPLAKKDGAQANITDLKGGETFCLCGLALLAVEFTTSPAREARLAALLAALREATGAKACEEPSAAEAKRKGLLSLGDWSDAKGRTPGQVEAAVKKALSHTLSR